MSGSGADDTLIAELRHMVGAGSAEYTVDGTAFWTDEQLQEEIEKAAMPRAGHPVEVTVYETFQGTKTARFGTLGHIGYIDPADTGEITDAEGNAVDAAISLHGAIAFEADVYDLAPLVWAGTSYDLHGAAARILDAWVAAVSTAYDVTVDGQSMKRSQMVTQLRDRAGYHRAQAISEHIGGRMASVETSAPLW